MDDQLRIVLDKVPLLKDRAVLVTALGGGITNRNFRLDTGDSSFVLRIGGENTELLGIDREREHACSRAAASCGVGPEVIAFLPEHRALLTRFADAKVLTAEDVRQPDVMGRVIDALRKFHNGPEVPGRFSAFDGVRDYYRLAREHEVSLPSTIGDALHLLASLEQRLAAEKLYPCHDDLLPGNLLDDGKSIRIIDWEYAGMGDRFFDLGNLAANAEFRGKDEELLIELYFGALDPEHLEYLRLMRLVSDMREAMWGFLQAGISRLDFQYSEYGQQHLNRFLERCASTGLRPAASAF